MTRRTSSRRIVRRIAVTPLYCEVRVLLAWDLGTVEAYAVYANGNAIKPAARAFIDFLAHDFRGTPP